MTDPLTGGGDGATPVHPDDLVGLRLGWIATQGELNEAESQNLEAGRAWADGRPHSLEQLLDDRWLMDLHRRCFGVVWSWAGTPRRHGTSIGIDPVEVIRATRDAMFDARAQLDADSARRHTARILARLHHRLAAIHPFANGNGRTLRLHADLMARALSLPSPTWGMRRDDARNEYHDALRAADAGDTSALEKFIWS